MSVMQAKHHRCPTQGRERVGHTAEQRQKSRGGLSHDDARDVLEGSDPVECALRDELLLLAPRVRKPPTTADNHKQPRVSKLP